MSEFSARTDGSLRVGVFATHPVQYHACLWRGLAREPGIAVKVFYFSDQGVAIRVDPGFGEAFAWDQDLLAGYEHEFVTRVPIDRTLRAAIPRAVSEAWSFDAVLLHGYNTRFSRDLAHLRRRRGYRMLLRGEFSDIPRPWARWWRTIVREIYLRWFYRAVDHFCPVGRAAVEHLERRGIVPDRYTVTPYSVDDGMIERQKKQFPRAESRRALGLPDEAIVFLFCGKLIPRKQPLLLAEALAGLAADRRVHLAIVGSGEQFQAVEARLRPVLGERLLMPGFVNQSQMGRYHAAADVAVLPSIYDTWGLAVNEAMHWGLPCIVSDRVGCNLDLITEGKTGFVFPAGNAKALSDRLRRFLDDTGLARGMQPAVVERIGGYTSGRTVAALVMAIRRAVGRGGPNHAAG